MFHVSKVDLYIFFFIFSRYQKPVSVTLERQDDIKMSGQRHGFLGRYKLAADENGKILGLDLELYMNAGHSKDVSPIVSLLYHY